MLVAQLLANVTTNFNSYSHKKTKHCPKQKPKKVHKADRKLFSQPKSVLISVSDPVDSDALEMSPITDTATVDPSSTR